MEGLFATNREVRLFGEQGTDAGSYIYANGPHPKYEHHEPLRESWLNNEHYFI
jgi:hypothetical protein